MFNNNLICPLRAALEIKGPIKVDSKYQLLSIAL